MSAAVMTTYAALSSTAAVYICFTVFGSDDAVASPFSCEGTQRSLGVQHQATVATQYRQMLRRSVEVV